jgi:dTDP-glucose 4,6-dehydratase
MADNLNVLLTGGGGFVGHHTLAHMLKTTNWSITVIDSFRHLGLSARLRAVFEELPQHRSRVKVVTHDLIAPIDSVTSKLIGQVDVIVNMASLSSVDASIQNPRNFIENNTSLQLTMLEYARSIESLKLFLHISTDEVYGPAQIDVEHEEWDSIIPSNPYSASKAAQEAIAVSYWRTYGIPLVITNTMNIIGERQDVEKFVPLCIARLLRNERVPIHARLSDSRWESGSRFYLHARNQADALIFLINKYRDNPSLYLNGHGMPLRFNVRGEIEMKNDEMAHLIAEILGKDPRSSVQYINVEGARPGHDLRYALNGKLLRDLGWNPPVPFKESLERTVRWSVNNSNWLLLDK